MKRAPARLRTRILLWHGLLLLGLLTAFGVTAWRLHREDGLRRIDQELGEPLAWLHRALHDRGGERADGPPPPPGFPPPDFPPPRFQLSSDLREKFASRHWDYAVWARGGRLIESSDPAAFTRHPPRSAASGAGTERLTLDGHRHAYTFTPPGECLLVSASLDAELRSASRLGWWLLAMGTGVLTGGLLVDAWILRRAIRPVEEIIGAAERISRGNLSARIGASGTSAELDRLTAVLNHTFASLDQAFAQQARFSADAAHELRTPVSVLIAEAQSTLERERSGEDYRESLATCLRSARRLRDIIESLLSLARIQADGAAVLTPCDLAVLARENLTSLQSLSAPQNITVSAALDPAVCQGDPGLLSQIIANLLLNAIRHNQSGGTVTVRTASDGGDAVLTVENTGPGIAPGDLPRIFDRFYRTDASRSRKSGGVGLGLAICQAIADAHSAKLTAESVPGELTRFQLRVPLRPVAGSPAPATSGAVGSPRRLTAPPSGTLTRPASLTQPP